MGKFSSIINKFKAAQEEIKKIGSEIVEAYPDSDRLIEMAKEIEVAVSSLDFLASTLEEALQTAEIDSGVYKQLIQQMKDSDIYSKFPEEEKEKLAEFLTQKKLPLLDAEMLKKSVVEGLRNKSSADLVSMYPKALVVERGMKMDDGSDAFDAYSSGLKAYQHDFDTDKVKAVEALAEVWLERGLDVIAKEYYEKLVQKTPSEEKVEK